MSKIKKLVRCITSQEGDRFNIEYELIGAETDNDYSYGIAISTYTNEGKLNEFVEIPNISENFIEMHTLFMVLYKHEVTPITLYDVMDVLLADLDLLNQY